MIVALLGLLILGVSFLNGVAIASSITVLVVMTAAVTLHARVPGHVRDARCSPRRSAARLEAEGPHDPKVDGRWPQWAALRPEAPGAAGHRRAAVHARAGDPGARRCASAPPTPARTRRTRPPAQAYDLLAKGFGPGFNGTFQIVAKTPNGKADLPKVAALAKALGSTEGIAAVSPPVPSPNGKIALIEAKPTYGAAGRSRPAT